MKAVTFLRLPRKKTALLAALALVAGAALWRAAGWSPDWPWVSDVFAGDFLADGAGPARVSWTGLWDDQRLVSSDSRLRASFFSLLLGRRVAVASLADEGLSAEMEIRRPWGAPAPGELPFLRAALSASGAAREPFVLLRQISAAGSWKLSAAASRLDAQTAHWDLNWVLENARIEFGPSDREKPAGTLLLSRVEGRAERDGLTLDLLEFRGTGEGVALTGRGSIRAAADPLGSVLSLSFHLTREADSKALRAEGWDEAIAGSEEMTIAVQGTVAEPVFYLNGFPLRAETLESGVPSKASNVNERIVETAASNLGVERTEAAPDEPPAEGEAPEPYAGYSESDIRKMQALLNSRVTEERRRKVEGHSSEYRKRWKELKQAYKDELKKLQAEGVDLRKEFGKKPNRQMRELISSELDREFPKETEDAKKKDGATN